MGMPVTAYEAPGAPSSCVIQSSSRRRPFKMISGGIASPTASIVATTYSDAVSTVRSFGPNHLTKLFCNHSLGLGPLRLQSCNIPKLGQARSGYG